jgi:hypothetical protein
MIKSSRMIRAVYVARMGQMISSYKNYVGNPKGKRALWKLRRRREGNIKTGLE